MAHIADFMVNSNNSNNSNNAGLNNMIARELSPDSSSSNSSRTNVGIGRRDQAQQHTKFHPQLTETAPTTATTTPTEEKERYVWRMHQPSESRKFTLFPAKDKLPSISTAAGRKGSDAERVTEQTSSQGQGEGKNVLRKQQKEQTLVRRRKVSVPELGPMTTVQEVAMDSPTIPGRPPLHERSISAPGNSWRQHMFGESIISCISGPTLDENAELENLPGHEYMDAPSRPGSTSPKLPPISPKVLAPLVIPNVQSTAPRLLRSRSYSNRLRSDSSSRDPSAPDVPPKTGRMNMSVSPHPRVPFTPLSSTTTLVGTPCSASEGREPEKPWEKSAGPSPMGHSRGQSEATHQRSAHNLGHRRGESESSASIMDRGRPKKRQETGGSPMKRAMSKSKRSPSSEKKAFETLPQGHRAANVNTVLQRPELEALRKQAIGQASRFEVLNSKDVDALSRELRALDERCDYLRKTHKSLRSGRRNLHDRICSYLRSPRVARFSHESILKQEEALSELDTSIDDWAIKLEYAENRRMRVRQKLLEHVAAALILPTKPEEEHQQEQQQGGRSYESSVHALSTPPRSPTKPQSRVPSPQRLAEPVPVQVASPERESSRSRKDVPSMASIKIYADSDVYALLADVEEEITRMGDQSQNPEGLAPSPELSQGKSGEMLSAATFQLPQRTYQATTAGFV